MVHIHYIKNLAGTLRDLACFGPAFLVWNLKAILPLPPSPLLPSQTKAGFNLPGERLRANLV